MTPSSQANRQGGATPHVTTHYRVYVAEGHQDGGGAILHLGGHGGPVPVGPWGPFMERAVRAASVGSLSHGRRGSAEIGKIAAT